MMETNSASSVWQSLGDLADDDITHLYNESYLLSEPDVFDMEAAINQKLDWKPLSGGNWLANAGLLALNGAP